MKLVGRTREKKRLINYATSEPENKAFFGVKGVGKSTLIEAVFSRANCKAYAEEYQYLFVRTILSPEIKGDDLTNFLLDRVINGIDLIEDEVMRDSIHAKMKQNEEKYYSKESLLREILETIKDYEYSMILVMDDFHNMGRNNEVGSAQYDYLRSLNELGLVYYWVISDSDFSDVYATSQFTTSFFAQKFIPETIPHMNDTDAIQLLKETAEKYDVTVSDDVLSRVNALIGGLPGLMTPAIKSIELLGETDFNENDFVQQLLENPKCISLMSSWSRSLTEEQKDLLFDIAQRESILQNDNRDKIGRINQLGDNSGLGLLVHYSGPNGVSWQINSVLFARYIVDRTDDFYANEITPAVVERDTDIHSGPTYIQNNYYTINNAFFNAEGAVNALVGLKQLLGSSTPELSSPNNRFLTEAIKQLPFQQDEWEEIDEDQKEERINEYADSVFKADEFRTGGLSENQMKRFSLTDEILDHLSETSRNSLISAIQVYDILQFCVDRFGITATNIESARGILFAKLYETILKENLRQALISTKEGAETEVLENFLQQVQL